MNYGLSSRDRKSSTAGSDMKDRPKTVLGLVAPQDDPQQLGERKENRKDRRRWRKRFKF